MTKISLTPIIDVVFILLIFFMLATNFQNFNKTDINLTKSSAASTVTDKKVFIIAFDDNSNFKLGNQDMTMEQIKEKILYETKSDQNYAVVVKPEDNTKFQTTLYVLEDLKRTKIQNVMLGINRMKKEIFVGTSIIFFSCVNLIKLPLYIYLSMMNFDTLYQSVTLFPLALIGIFIGYKLLKIIEENLFYNIIYALILVSSAKLIIDFI